MLPRHRLAILRHLRGLSQPALAVLLDCPQQAISQWETGRRRLLAEDLPHLATVLGVPVEAFLTAAPLLAVVNIGTPQVAKQLAAIAPEHYLLSGLSGADLTGGPMTWHRALIKERGA